MADAQRRNNNNIMSPIMLLKQILITKSLLPFFLRCLVRDSKKSKKVYNTAFVSFSRTSIMSQNIVKSDKRINDDENVYYVCTRKVFVFRSLSRYVVVVLSTVSLKLLLMNTFRFLFVKFYWIAQWRVLVRLCTEEHNGIFGSKHYKFLNCFVYIKYSQALTVCLTNRFLYVR